MLRRFPLANELDHEARLRATRELIRQFHRPWLVTTGYVHKKRSGYFAYIETKRLRPDDYDEGQLEKFQSEPDARTP